MSIVLVRSNRQDGDAARPSSRVDLAAQIDALPKDGQFYNLVGSQELGLWKQSNAQATASKIRSGVLGPDLLAIAELAPDEDILGNSRRPRKERLFNVRVAYRGMVCKTCGQPVERGNGD